MKDNPSQWEATDLKGNSTLFDSIIITIPIPQLLNLKGSIQTHIKDDKESLEAVRYSSRYALGLFYAPGTDVPLPWTAKYVTGNPCIRFVSVDSKKRGQGRLNILLNKICSSEISGLQCNILCQYLCQTF